MRTPWIVPFFGLVVVGCGASRREPTLASQALPLALATSASGQLASACDRTVWSFQPETAGSYRFEATSEVPMALRLFSTSPDLYLETGRTDGGVARLEGELHPDTTYAVTLVGTDCRPTHYAMSVARAE
jgi:hypothetical protein